MFMIKASLSFVRDYEARLQYSISVVKLWEFLIDQIYLIYYDCMKVWEG